MKTKIKKIDISSISPLLLFTVFSVCVLLVLLTGASVYEGFTERDRISYDHRTISQYLTTRVRQSDAIDAYRVGDFADTAPAAEGNTFFFCEEHGGVKYATRIYCHDGYLYELFGEAEANFDPHDGEKILPMQSADFKIEDGMIIINVVYADGTGDVINIKFRSAKEGSL